jgi:hypothetical protein
MFFGGLERKAEPKFPLMFVRSGASWVAVAHPRHYCFGTFWARPSGWMVTKVYGLQPGVLLPRLLPP